MKKIKEPSSPKKNKVSRYYKGNKQIREHVDVIFNLELEAENIKTSLINIHEKYNSLAVSKNETDRWIDKLPLNSLSDFYTFEKGSFRFNLESLQERSSLKKEMIAHSETLKKKDCEIYLKHLDLLKEKINHMIAKLDI